MNERWREIAFEIWGSEEMPLELQFYLEEIAQRTKNAGGELVSRQVIAAAVVTYGLIESTRKSLCTDPYDYDD